MSNMLFKRPSVAIFAAGQSSRFPSPLGKMAYPLDGKPILLHTLEKVLESGYEEILLVLSMKNFHWFHKHYPDYLTQKSLKILIQHEPLGTGDALKLVLSVATEEKILVMNGDCPLVSPQVWARLERSSLALAVASTAHPFPQGYGRILREENRFLGMIEDKELSSQHAQLMEINAGVYCVDASLVRDSLGLLDRVHAQNECYLTDLWSVGSPLVEKTEVCFFQQYRQFQGVNTWEDFETVEDYYYQQKRSQAVAQGAILSQAATVFFQGSLGCLEPGVHIQGPVILKNRNILKAAAQIHPFSSLDGVQIGENAQIGPFASLSQKTQIGPSCEIGSFVEVKRSIIGSFTKAKHFAYLADCTVGMKCNIGAFVVTCNYNGHKKNHTQVEDEAFIGAASQLIAPLKVGYKAYIGAATVVTEDVPCATLITRRAAVRLRPFNKQRFLCAESSQP